MHSRYRVTSSRLFDIFCRMTIEALGRTRSPTDRRSFGRSRPLELEVSAATCIAASRKAACLASFDLYSFSAYAIRPSLPFRDIYCNPLPYAASLRLGPRVGVPARFTAAAREENMKIFGELRSAPRSTSNSKTSTGLRRR
jgi:hypothetical protein